MTRAWTIVAIFSISAIGCADDPVGEMMRADPGDVVVYQEQAYFILPAGDQPIWRWNLESTPPGQREYRWEVETARGDSVITFGLSGFKAPTYEPRSGSLKQLVASGQESFWIDQRTVIGPSVQAIALTNRVAIHLYGQDTVERLFADRADSVILHVKRPGQGAISQAAAVEYRF